MDTITLLGSEKSWIDPQPHSHTQMGFPLSKHKFYPGPSRRQFLTAEFVTKSSGMTEDTLVESFSLSYLEHPILYYHLLR